jgi:hypothetical protein
MPSGVGNKSSCCFLEDIAVRKTKPTARRYTAKYSEGKLFLVLGPNSNFYKAKKTNIYKTHNHVVSLMKDLWHSTNAQFNKTDFTKSRHQF